VPKERIASRLVLPPMDLALRVQRGPLQMGATRSSACVRGAPLLVLIRRRLFFLLPEPGERKGRGGWARPAAPRPCSRGPELARPHPAALWSLVCCGAGVAGVGEQGTSRSGHLCASGRGHLPGRSRRCVPGVQGTEAPDARPRPPSRQSRGLSAIHRFSRSAMPFLITSHLSRQGREDPGLPRGRSIWGGAPSARGLPSPVARGRPPRDVLAFPTDRVTTVTVGSSCRRSRAGSDKEVTKETAGCSARGWSGILKGQDKGGPR
jgi:hypothetical protein